MSDINSCVVDLRPEQSRLNMIFIVLEVTKPNRTRDGRIVRTCKVADRTGCVDLTVWDELGEHLQSGDIYKLTRGFTNVFKGCLTLNVPKVGILSRLGDFCMVFSENLNMSDANNEAVKAYLAQQSETRVMEQKLPEHKETNGENERQQTQQKGNINNPSLPSHGAYPPPQIHRAPMPPYARPSSSTPSRPHHQPPARVDIDIPNQLPRRPMPSGTPPPLHPRPKLAQADSGTPSPLALSPRDPRHAHNRPSFSSSAVSGDSTMQQSYHRHASQSSARYANKTSHQHSVAPRRAFESSGETQHGSTFVRMF